MRILIIKTSSLGDLIHTFPALTDASRHFPEIQFDWIAEEAFASIPAMHPAVDRVIPSAMRRWRKSWIRTWLQGDWKRFIQMVQAHRYDAVIDAQGLIKSALITRKALGVKHGLDRTSARESQASLFYDKRYAIDKNQHAIQRVRELFAQSLGYELTDLPLDYGLDVSSDESVAENTVLFLHGTTWKSKQWPLAFWLELAEKLAADGLKILLPAGNDEEREFAQRIAEGAANAEVLASMALVDIASVIKACRAVVSVDTGLAHLAAALDVPGVSLYGATDAKRTGTLGQNQSSLQTSYACSPCFLRECNQLEPDDLTPPCTKMLTAVDVSKALRDMMTAAS